jgi:hypothetical protein
MEFLSTFKHQDYEIFRFKLDGRVFEMTHDDLNRVCRFLVYEEGVPVDGESPWSNITIQENTQFEDAIEGFQGV